MKTDNFLTVAEVAALLKLGNSTVWRLVKRGSLPSPVKIGGATRWNESEVAIFIASLTEQQRCRAIVGGRGATELSASLEVAR
jgi:excisionase family DNA binding protein